jgi:hypothetical protein
MVRRPLRLCSGEKAASPLRQMAGISWPQRRPGPFGAASAVKGKRAQAAGSACLTTSMEDAVADERSGRRQRAGAGGVDRAGVPERGAGAGFVGGPLPGMGRQRRVAVRQSRPRRASCGSSHFRYAPKATAGRQNVARREVPIAEVSNMRLGAPRLAFPGNSALQPNPLCPWEFAAILTICDLHRSRYRRRAAYRACGRARGCVH